MNPRLLTSSVHSSSHEAEYLRNQRPRSRKSCKQLKESLNLPQGHTSLLPSPSVPCTTSSAWAMSEPQSSVASATPRPWNTATSLIWHRQGPSLALSVPMIYNSATRMDWLSLANWISPHLQERQPREAEAGRWSKKISVIGEVVAVRKFPQVNLQKKLEGRVVLLAKRCHGQKKTHLIAFLHFLIYCMPVIRGILK